MFRVIFWLYAVYIMVISCIFSLAFYEIGMMILKIIFFPVTIIFWPIVAMISGHLSGWFFWIWLAGMGSYSISCFYGKLRPI